MDERAVQELRELAERDSELATRGAAVAARDAEIARIRSRAEEIETALALQPAERARRDRELVDAAEELERRRSELDRAERELAAATDDDAREHARHAVERALDHIAVAQSRIDRAEAARAELEQEVADLPAERQALEDQARALAGTPELGGSLVDWASRAHADAFVAAGQIDAERERVIREANELASMLLGEPTYGATVAQALARVEGLSAGETRKQ
jgi:predicted  nucleic acid-binding Zn-ribbon protein